jgi:hypothetical protein
VGFFSILLGAEQKEAIRKFLEVLREISSDDLAPDIEEALLSYWNNLDFSDTRPSGAR